MSRLYRSPKDGLRPAPLLMGLCEYGLGSADEPELPGGIWMGDDVHSSDESPVGERYRDVTGYYRWV